MKMDEFFETHIPKDLMPSNYEGNLASLEELTKQNLQLLCSLKEFYKKEEDQRNFIKTKSKTKKCAALG